MVNGYQTDGDGKPYNLMTAAEKQVDALRSEVRTGRIRTSVLAGVCAALVVVSVVLGLSVHQSDRLAGSIQQGSVEQCQAGNTLRANDSRIWDSFIQLILKGSTDQKAIAEGKQFEALVAKVDTPRDCSVVFNTTGSSR
jgi:hypothetical protein